MIPVDNDLRFYSQMIDVIEDECSIGVTGTCKTASWRISSFLCCSSLRIFAFEGCVMGAASVELGIVVDVVVLRIHFCPI